MALKLEPGSRLVMATHNPDKARELAEILEYLFSLTAAGDIGLPEPEGPEATFAGNAVRRQGLRLRPDLPPLGQAPDVRRDRARDQGRHEPPGPRLRQAEGRALVTSSPKLGVYLHWPYCARICPYCDFNVVRARGGDE